MKVYLELIGGFERRYTWMVPVDEFENIPSEMKIWFTKEKVFEKDYYFSIFHVKDDETSGWYRELEQQMRELNFKWDFVSTPNDISVCKKYVAMCCGD